MRYDLYRKIGIKSKFIKIFHRFLQFFTKTKPIKWDNWIDKTYILHLSDRTDRFKLLNKELSKIKTTTGKLSKKVIWFPGFRNKKDWNKKDFSPKYTFNYHHYVDPLPSPKGINSDLEIECSIPESMCALGHLGMWRKFLDSNAEVACFLEDDIEFTYRYDKTITDIFEKELPPDWDMIYLSSEPARYGFDFVEHSKNLFKVHKGLWWLSGYVLTRRAAKILLDNLPITGPVDAWINHQLPKLNVFSAKNNVIYQSGKTPSDNFYSFREKGLDTVDET
tara:strand:- start:3624 stop:4457 length:834 start_codon:yes stop_codon:yes gene_type:complete